MRDSYTSGYFRQEQKSGLMGVYESTGLHEAWAPRGYPEWESSNELFPDELDRIAPWLERAIERMPIFGEVADPPRHQRRHSAHAGRRAAARPGAGVAKFLDVLRHVLRHCAGRRLRQVPGAVDGARRCRNQHDRVRPAAFRPFRGQDRTCGTRCSWIIASPSPPGGPGEEEMAGRPRKTSPLYERLRRAGLRALPKRSAGSGRSGFRLDGRDEDYGYRRNNVFEVVRDEVAAVHERVGILDLTGFAKYDISGPDAESFLNRVCANRIPRKVGGIALVHMLSPGGTHSRRDDREPPGRGSVLRAFRRRGGAARSGLVATEPASGEAVRIEDVTEERGVLVLSGPRSRELLASVDRCALRATRNSRWLTAREIRVAGHPLRALRVSYVGELGWELHPPIGSMAPLYEALWEHGGQFGIAELRPVRGQ